MRSSSLINYIRAYRWSKLARSQQEWIEKQVVYEQGDKVIVYMYNENAGITLEVFKVLKFLPWTEARHQDSRDHLCILTHM